MARDIKQVRRDAALEVVTWLCRDTSPDLEGMRGFAEAIAEAAVVAQHLIQQAETETSGDSIH